MAEGNTPIPQAPALAISGGVSKLGDLREVPTVPEALSWDHLPPYGVPPWFLITIAINTAPKGHFPSCSQSMQLRIFLYTGEFDLKVFNAPIQLQLLGEMQARVKSAGSSPCASNRTSSLHILQIKAKYGLDSSNPEAAR